ncbi:MAG: site-2 protease family protein [Turicibacter sp.]
MISEKLKFDFSFYGMSLLAIYSGYYTEWIIFFITIAIHECGHLVMASIFKWKLKDIKIFGYGGVMTFEGELNKSNMEDISVSFGGILFNILFLLVILSIPTRFLDIQNLRIQSLYIQAQLFVIAFNLLPLPPLDGNRIMISLLSLFFPYKYVLSFNKWISFILLGVIYVVTIYYDFRQYFIIITYISISTIRFNRQIPYLFQRFVLQKKMYNNPGLSMKTTILSNHYWEMFLYKVYQNGFLINNRLYNETQLLDVKYGDNFLSLIDDKRKY